MNHVWLDLLLLIWHENVLFMKFHIRMEFHIIAPKRLRIRYDKIDRLI